MIGRKHGPGAAAGVPGRRDGDARWGYRLLLAALAVLCAAFAGPAQAGSASSASGWERWGAHDATSSAAIDHGPWDRFLKAYVRPGPDGINRVAYGAVTAADRAALDAYVRALAGTSISRFNRDEQFAFWVNLYNALTVGLVLDAYPVATIRSIDGGLLATGPWDRKVVTVEGQSLSLNDIEHRILRPQWRDPRVHYVVNCASLGCPNLPAAAFTGAGLDPALNQAGRDFVNHPRAAHFDGQGGLVLSSIYAWFEGDFGGSQRMVIDHLSGFAEPALRARLDGLTMVAGYGYDWSLNDAKE